MSAKLYALPLALGLMGAVAAVEAAPSGLPGTTAALKAEATEAGPIENVTWRRCWSDGFYTRCWRPAPRVYSFYYARPRPYAYWGWRRY
jgi:hypothetical protein